MSLEQLERLLQADEDEHIEFMEAKRKLLLIGWELGGN